MIDPRRKAQNDAVAASLLAFQDELADRMSELDPKAWLGVEQIHRGAKRRGVLSPFLRTAEEIFPSLAALEAADPESRIDRSSPRTGSERRGRLHSQWRGVPSPGTAPCG